MSYSIFCLSVWKIPTIFVRMLAFLFFSPVLIPVIRRWRLISLAIHNMETRGREYLQKVVHSKQFSLNWNIFWTLLKAGRNMKEKCLTIFQCLWPLDFYKFPVWDSLKCIAVCLQGIQQSLNYFVFWEQSHEKQVPIWRVPALFMNMYFIQINQTTLKCLLAYDILCYNMIDLQAEEKHMIVWMIKSEPARCSVEIILHSGMAVSLLSSSRHQTVHICDCP